MAQQVKDLALSQQQLESLLWHELDPWSGNFHMPRMCKKKKKKKKKNFMKQTYQLRDNNWHYFLPMRKSDVSNKTQNFGKLVSPAW